jgi:hypothetical protein
MDNQIFRIKQIYFDIHRELNIPNIPFGKVKNQLSRQVVFYYRLLRLRILCERRSLYKIFASTSKKNNSVNI